MTELTLDESGEALEEGYRMLLASMDEAFCYDEEDEFAGFQIITIH